MPTDDLNIDEINDSRRKAIEESIHAISVEELKKLGESLFPHMEHPWRDKFFTFLSENPDAAYYHATTRDRIHFIYCSSKERGFWFLPGSGLGPLQARGLGILKQVVEGLH
jgi:hypothetical protein